MTAGLYFTTRYGNGNEVAIMQQTPFGKSNTIVTDGQVGIRCSRYLSRMRCISGILCEKLSGTQLCYGAQNVRLLRMKIFCIFYRLLGAYMFRICIWQMRHKSVAHKRVKIQNRGEIALERPAECTSRPCCMLCPFSLSWEHSTLRQGDNSLSQNIYCQ